MDSTTKQKTLNLEDYQGGSRVVLNKVFGNDGTCSTAAATAAKEVTLGTTFNLVTGATLLVKFTNGISVANSTLSVTHTPIGAQQAVTETAKPIYLKGAALEPDVIDAGSTVILRYNGTQYDIIGGAGDGGADAAFLDDYDGQGAAPDFDAYLDTVHTTAQTLTDAKKQQARENIGAEVITYNSTTGMLQKTVGSTTDNIVSIVNSGFDLTTDDTAGKDTFSAIGTAELEYDSESGKDVFTF